MLSATLSERRKTKIHQVKTVDHVPTGTKLMNGRAQGSICLGPDPCSRFGELNFPPTEPPGEVTLKTEASEGKGLVPSSGGAFAQQIFYYVLCMQVTCLRSGVQWRARHRPRLPGVCKLKSISGLNSLRRGMPGTLRSLLMTRAQQPPSDAG